MRAVSALDVARAALMEVGGDPAAVWEVDDPLIAGRRSLNHDRAPASMRAALLGLMAQRGPDFVVRCVMCLHPGPPWSPPCTPVRDVLRGVTCGRAA